MGERSRSVADAPGRAIGLTGVVLVIGGSMLPWVISDPIGIASTTRYGLDVHGEYTLALAAVAAAVLLFRDWDRGTQATLLACGAGIGVIAAAYVADLRFGYELVPAEGLIEAIGKEFAEVGVGVWVTLVGGLTVALGGVLGLLGR